MRAEYDSEASAISIALSEVEGADGGDQVHARAIVAVVQGRAVEVQVLYPDLGVEEPLAAAAERYALDREGLIAAAHAALAAPDRAVTLDVDAGAAA